MNCLFLDRDGILNPPPPKENGGYLIRAEDFGFQSGIVEFLKEIQKKDILLIVITNQQCIGKGILTVQDLQKIHDRMQEMLMDENIYIHKIYYCPHLKEEACICRKPKPGMLVQAMEEFSLKPDECGFLGDSKTDMQAGISAQIGKNFYYPTKTEDLNDLPEGSYFKVNAFKDILSLI